MDVSKKVKLSLKGSEPVVEGNSGEMINDTRKWISSYSLYLHEAAKGPFLLDYFCNSYRSRAMSNLSGRPHDRFES